MKKIIFTVLITIISVGLFCGYGFAGDNTNENTNINKNGNSEISNNKVTSETNNEQTASINKEVHSKSTTRREFGPSPGLILPGFAGNYQSKTSNKSYEYKPIQETIRSKPMWLKSEIKQFIKDDDFENIKYEVRTVAVNNSYDPVEDYRMKYTVVYPDPDHREYIGEIYVKVDGEDVTSSSLHTFVGLKTILNSGNVAVATNQGAKKLMASSGIGVSLGLIHTSISGGPQRNAATESVGVGYAESKSGFDKNPFARFQIYEVDEDYFENLPLFPSK